MAELNLTWQFDNTFRPSYVSPNLKWYERDGLDTWYKQNKCQEFLENTDKHFEQRKIKNFDMINDGEKRNKIIQQHQTVGHEEIKKYPFEHQHEITSLYFAILITKTYMLIIQL